MMMVPSLTLTKLCAGQFIFKVIKHNILTRLASKIELIPDTDINSLYSSEFNYMFVTILQRSSIELFHLCPRRINYSCPRRTNLLDVFLINNTNVIEAFCCIIISAAH